MGRCWSWKWGICEAVQLQEARWGGRITPRLPIVLSDNGYSLEGKKSMSTKKTMKLMSWNVDDWRIKRVEKNKLKLDRQIDAIAKVRADIVALQEVSSAVAEYFKEKLSKIGLEYVKTSHQFGGPSQYGVLIASLHPLKIQPRSGLKNTGGAG